MDAADPTESRVTRGIRTPVYAQGGVLQSRRHRSRIGSVCRSSSAPRKRAGSSRAGRSSKARAETPASDWRSRPRFADTSCIFTMPDKMSQEKVRLLKAFGAEVIVTPTAVPPDHPDNYVMMAKRIAEETPNAILADQFYNDANPGSALRDHGPGALGTDRRQDHALRSIAQEPAERSLAWALPQREEQEDQGHCRGSSGLDTGRILAQPRRRTRSKARPTRSRESARTNFPARSTWV